MATMNISLPDALKAWAERQGASGRYANVSDYVRDLIRRDHDEWEAKIAHMQALVDEARAGESREISREELRERSQRAFLSRQKHDEI